MVNYVERTVKLTKNQDKKLDERKKLTGIDKANQFRTAIDRYIKQVIQNGE